jgi:hypothetical protein
METEREKGRQSEADYDIDHLSEKQNCIRAVALQYTLRSGQTSTKQLQQSRQLAAHVHGREKNFFFKHEKNKIH